MSHDQNFKNLILDHPHQALAFFAAAEADAVAVARITPVRQEQFQERLGERFRELYAQAIRGLTELESDPEKQLKYLDFIDIYAALDDNERAEYQRDYPDEVKTMSRFAERFREEGMQQGEALVLGYCYLFVVYY